MKKNLFSQSLILVLFVAVFAGFVPTVGAQDEAPVIRVGSKDFTESYLLGEIYSLALEDAGFTVDRQLGIGSAIVHTALVNDEIDLYPEYTGTGLLAILQLPLETDPQKVFETVKSEYEKQFDLVWLDYASANDSLALIVKTDVAESLGIATISDLQANANELRIVAQGGFYQREDALPALEAVYGKFDWKSSSIVDDALKYELLENGEAEVAYVAATEGRLTDPKFTVLEDDKQVWPPYNIAPVIRKPVLDANPEIAGILKRINEKIDNPTIIALNAKVDIDKEEYEDVAAEFYDTIRE